MKTKKNAATATETPLISTKTEQTANVPAEGKNAAETAKYRISRCGNYKIFVGDREQAKVIAVLKTVNNNTLIEISDDAAGIATMGEIPLHIDKTIMELTDADVLELIQPELCRR